MSDDNSKAGGQQEFTFYHYDPSLGAAAAFVIIFAFSTFVHLFQMFRNRTWYFISFVIGCLCKLSLLIYQAAPSNTIYPP